MSTLTALNAFYKKSIKAYSSEVLGDLSSTTGTTVCTNPVTKTSRAISLKLAIIEVYYVSDPVKKPFHTRSLVSEAI